LLDSERIYPTISVRKKHVGIRIALLPIRMGGRAYDPSDAFTLEL